MPHPSEGGAPPPPPPPPPLPESVPTTKELVDKLFEGIDDIPEIESVTPSNIEFPAMADLQVQQVHGSSSSLSGQDSISSSNDNFGLWDDVKFEENVSDTSSDSNTSGVLTTPITDDDDALLDTWLKELEATDKRMSRLLSPDHAAVPAPPTTTVEVHAHYLCTLKYCTWNKYNVHVHMYSARN